MKNRCLDPIYIVGPTATGKSDLAIAIAKALDGVIISADSMQIYRGLDIGTAKVGEEQRLCVPHRLIDIVDVDAQFSVAEFAQMAQREIKNAQDIGKLPIVVGGTGLYFEALIYPLSFAGTVKNDDLRDYLTAFYESNGAAALHDMLNFFDANSAERLHVNDVKRVIRALEIVLTTSKPMSENADEGYADDAKHITMIGLIADRAELYKRVNERVDRMFDDGLTEEALSVGDFEYQSMQAIGYKEFKSLEFDVVDGKKVPNKDSLERVKELIKQHTRNYAKRQITWFKRYKFAKWFDISEREEALEYAISRVCGKD